MSLKVHVRRDVQHRQAVRVLLRDLVHDVEREVELVVVLVADVDELAVAVLLALDELLGQQRLVGLAPAHPDHRLRLLLGVAGHDHRDEGAALAADRHHAVGRGGLVEDRVAGVQRLLVVAHLHPHRAGDHEVELLSGVGGGVDRRALLALVVVVGHVVRRGEPALEHRGHVADEDAALVHRHRALSGAADLEVRELGGVALEERVDVHPERKRALVQEGERGVHRPRLDCEVVPLVHAGQAGHLRRRLAADLAQFLDTRGHAPE